MDRKKCIVICGDNKPWLMTKIRRDLYFDVKKAIYVITQKR